MDFVKCEADRRAHRITRILDSYLQPLARLWEAQLTEGAGSGCSDLFRKALPQTKKSRAAAEDSKERTDGTGVLQRTEAEAGDPQPMLTRWMVEQADHGVDQLDSPKPTYALAGSEHHLGLGLAHSLAEKPHRLDSGEPRERLGHLGPDLHLRMT